jgi:hypothetical protein
LKLLVTAGAILIAAFLLIPAGAAWADPPEGSGGDTKGKSSSNPDGNGIDKPYSTGSGASIQVAGSQGTAPHDGNNGCGNDADREDDNNGNCGKKTTTGGGTTGGDTTGGRPAGGDIVSGGETTSPAEISVRERPVVSENMPTDVQVSVSSVRQVAAEAITQPPAIVSGITAAPLSSVGGVTSEVAGVSSMPTSDVLGVTFTAPSAGDGGLLDRSTRQTSTLSVLGLVFLGAGIVALRRAATRAS